jgi:hypothetical protein
MLTETLDGPDKDTSMHSVSRDNDKHIDPLDYMQRYIDNEGMPKRDRLLASAQLAPYKHARKTGQFISKALILPEPKDAEQARDQIAMIARVCREGGVTMEESTVLISHLQAYINASAVVDLVPRLAELERKEAARAERGDAVGLLVQSDMPVMPGLENVLFPGTLTIESSVDDRSANDAPQAGTSRESEDKPKGD